MRSILVGVIVASFAGAIAIGAAFRAYMFVMGLPFDAIPWRDALTLPMGLLALASILAAAFAGVLAAKSRWKAALTASVAGPALFAVVAGGHLALALATPRTDQLAVPEEAPPIGVAAEEAAPSLRPVVGGAAAAGAAPAPLNTLDVGGFPKAGVKPTWRPEDYAALVAEATRAGAVATLAAYNGGPLEAGRLTLKKVDGQPLKPSDLQRGAGPALCPGPYAPVAIRSDPKGAIVGWGVLRCTGDANHFSVDLDLWVESLGYLVTHRIEPTPESALLQLPTSAIFGVHHEPARWARLTRANKAPLLIEIGVVSTGPATFAFDERLSEQGLNEAIVLPANISSPALLERPSFTRADFPGRQVPTKSTRHITRRADLMKDADREEFLIIRYVGDLSDSADQLEIGELRDAPDGRWIGWAFAFPTRDGDAVALQMWLPERREIIAELAISSSYHQFDRSFRVMDAAGDWVRMSTSSAAPIWMALKEMPNLRLISLEDMLKSSEIYVTPNEPLIALMQEPYERSAAIGSFDINAPVHGVLWPTGRFDGEWMEVIRTIYGEGYENDECYGPQRPGPDGAEADLKTQRAFLSVQGWMRYRDGRRPLVTVNELICG
jgi:hypothetical protein